MPSLSDVNEISRGVEAEQLLNNPVFRDALDSVRGGIVSAMEMSAIGDDSTHHRLVIALQVLGKIEKQIKDHITTGKMARMTVHDGAMTGAITKLKKAING